MSTDGLFDFYYSKRHSVEINRKNYFNGSEYSECVPHGKKPSTIDTFDDLIFLGTGTMADVRCTESKKINNERNNITWKMI